MGLKSRLDVMGFCAGSNDAQANRLVVRQLEFENGFDDCLTHGKTVLSFAFFDDAQASCCVVMGQQALESEGDFHRTRHPNDVPDSKTVL
jgi:hypothetical protein